MKFFVRAKSTDSFETDGLALGAFENGLASPIIKSMDKALGGRLKKAMKAEQFVGKPEEIIVVDSAGALTAGKIVIAGLGKEKELTSEKIRQASAMTAIAMRDAGIKNFATTMASGFGSGISPSELAQAVVEGASLALYNFDQLKSEKSKKKVSSITLLTQSRKAVEEIKKGADKGAVVAESVCFARDLVNLPGNIVTPTYLANQAKSICSKFGIKCSILGPKAIKKLGMGGLEGVARGSDEPARFIVMEWMKGRKSAKPIALVGKGLTFDTGGISIKPSANMHEMKMDMSGGSAVIGTMRAIAALKLKVNVVGLVPTTENMSGGSALKPGDVLTGLSGVTMEVLNTDAEGRLILSDALAYAERYKPDCVVDLATLTGACMVALGYYASGLFGNDEKLINQVREAGELTGERCWPMPLWPEYEKEIKSDVADVQNIGPRWGGASTAAAFLKKHVKSKWAHVDIAGTAYTSKPRHYITKGAVGVGVRMMVRFIENRARGES